MFAVNHRVTSNIYMVLLHDKTPLCDQSSEVRNGVHSELYILQIPFTVRCANSEVLNI